MEKQKLLYQQARLLHRGASEMVLQTISASKGKKEELLTNLFIYLWDQSGTKIHFVRLILLGVIFSHQDT